MKGQSFIKRLRFAWRGLVETFLHEASFCIQVVAAFATVCLLLIIRPPIIWVALTSVMISLVLAAELINTALEHTLDGLHPEQANFVRLAKDSAAAAVLVVSSCSVIIFLLMLYGVYA